jgi:CO dehydrogenase maturation factor
MRIAIAGKGGAGKTTTAATLARILARSGARVTALDDDPNPNLSVALGLKPHQLAQLRLPPENLLEERIDLQGTASLHLTRPFDEVVDAYGVRGPDDVRLLSMTGVLGAGRG